MYFFFEIFVLSGVNFIQNIYPKNRVRLQIPQSSVTAQRKEKKEAEEL